MTVEELIIFLETLNPEAVVVYPRLDLNKIEFEALGRAQIVPLELKIEGKELKYVCLDFESYINA